MSLFQKVYYYALFYDSNGIYHGRQRIDEDDETFTYMNGEYVIKLHSKSSLTFDRIVYMYKYFYYNLGNPEPIEIRPNYEPEMTAQEFNVFINTKKMLEFNELGNEGGIWDILKKLLFNPVLWIIIVFLVVGYWYLSTHNWKLW